MPVILSQDLLVKFNEINDLVTLDRRDYFFDVVSIHCEYQKDVVDIIFSYYSEMTFREAKIASLDITLELMRSEILWDQKRASLGWFRFQFWRLFGSF